MAANETRRSTPSRTSKASSGATRVVYKPRPETTPNLEIGTLANAYAFVLECYAHNQTAVEPPADTNTTKVEGGDKSDEVRLIKRGGGRRARGS